MTESGVPVPGTSKPPVAIVTGGASGIGQAISLLLAQRDWVVVIADVDMENAQKTEVQINSQSGAALAVHVDVASESSVLALFDNIEEQGLQATALINNAAVQTWSPLLDLTLAQWSRTLSTNMTGTFLMTRSFARAVIKQQCSAAIVNIGSGCNHRAFPNLVDYTASKGGLEMLTKSSALELGPHRIRVNCVAPGAIETERTRQETGDYAASWSALTPAARIGQVNDVAKAVCWLLGPEADFVTGQTLAVDGGLFSAAPWPATY